MDFPPSPAPRRLSPGVIGLIIAAAVIVLGLAASLVLLRLTDSPAAPSSTGRIARPVSLLPVTDDYPAPCRTGDLPAGKPEADRCLALGSGMTVTAVDRIEMVYNPPSGWVIRISLLPEDATRFGDLTTRISQQSDPGNRLAIVVDAAVVSAPAVTTPILGPALEISGNFNQQEARRLFDSIRG
ncbi:hypothetical protein R8Z50_23925 [Longispora sp. K20-0274]|uniref:SecDF P1 head subdomain-containing protein n=1 Tax=Longispora sp. K20-0274 TaxID=3088255 RepID=UPI00399C0AB7